MKTKYIKKAVETVGRAAICKACNVDAKAVRRWEENQRLPRTDYTGETNYAERISSIPNVGVTFEQLLPLPARLRKRICGLPNKQSGMSGLIFDIWLAAIAVAGLCISLFDIAPKG